TIDTLDYSGTGLNEGSKLVIAAAGPCRRALATEVPASLRLSDGFHLPRSCMPGVLAVQAPAFAGSDGDAPPDVERFVREVGRAGRAVAWVVLTWGQVSNLPFSSSPWSEAGLHRGWADWKSAPTRRRQTASPPDLRPQRLVIRLACAQHRDRLDAPHIVQAHH